MGNEGNRGSGRVEDEEEYLADIVVTLEVAEVGVGS